MKPRDPVPSSRDAMAELGSPGRLLDCLNLAEGSGIGRGYPAWPALRADVGEWDLTRREGWAAIRIQRRVSSIRLPLEDSRGRPFRLSRCGEIDELVHGLVSRLDAPAGPVRAIWDSPDRFPWVAEARVGEAVALATLAGHAVDPADAAVRIRTSTRAESDAGRFVQSAERQLGAFTTDPVLPLTPANMRALHRHMTEGQAARRGVDTGWPREAPARESIDARMEALCDFAGGSGPFIHPVPRAVLLTLWGLHDRFFPSENVAVSYALMPWAFGAAGLDRLALSAVSAQRVATRSDMQRVLAQCAADENDATYVCLEELRLIHRSLDDLETRHSQWQSAHESWARESDLFRRLNRRQQWLMVYALDRPDCATSLAYHRREFNVVYETARTDLAGLVRSGLFDVRKRGKAQHFHAHPDLPSRLRSGPTGAPVAAVPAPAQRAPGDGLPAFF